MRTTSTLRLGAWALGGLAGGLLVWLLRGTLEAGPLVLAFGAGMLLVGLVGELAAALATLAEPAAIVPPAGAGPPDGRVEVVKMRGASGEPNPRDPRFSAFRSLAPGNDAPSRDRPGLRLRTSPPLLGRVAICSVFIGRDGRAWSVAEIAEAHAALFRAGEWIEREAARWQAPVNVGLADTYFVADDETPDDVEMTFRTEGDGVGPLEAGAGTKALIEMSRAAATLGFRDAADWMGQVGPRLDADALVWLLHPRRAGRSLAIPHDQSELAGVSLAVCYARESSFPEPLAGAPFTDPVTIAHELLHLFGATDKYGAPLRSFPPRSVSSRDIMRLSESRLSRLRIDARTAAELGWGTGPGGATRDDPGAAGQNAIGRPER